MSKKLIFRAFKFLILLLFLMGFHLSAITLNDAISTALKNNKSFNAEKYDYLNSKWNEKNALTNFFPKLDFNAMAFRIDDETYNEANTVYKLPVFDAFDVPTGDYVPISAGELSGGIYKTTYTTDITLQQPIFNGGKLFLGYTIARLSTKQALQSLASTQNDLEYNVADSYLNILNIQDMIKIANKSLASSRAQLKKIQDKFDVGMVTKSDVLQWEVKVENDKITLEQLKNSLSVLKTYWFNILGLQSLSDAAMPDRIDLTSYDNEISLLHSMSEVTKYDTLSYVLSIVKSENPDLKSLELTDRIAKTAHKLAISNFLPSFNLKYTRTFDQDDKLNFDGADTWNIAAVFSVPIFHFGTNITNLKKSSYEYKSTRLKLEDARQKILMAAENCVYDLITKAKKVMSGKLAYENAKENYSIVNDLFDQGMVTNTELMDSEIMLYSIELGLQTSYYDFVRAKYALEKYTNK
ncbi:MAG: TolC family protein [Candidatus Cloacimonetes bacterium]|nr:TolC family protein [Candidatus Cloacimonadota bacterium]